MTKQAGDLELAILKLRAGSFFPSLLERRRRIDQALHAVVAEAYVHGLSARSVDGLVKVLGSDTGIQERGLQNLRGAGRTAGGIPDASAGPHSVSLPVLDATYVKARVDHRIVSQAVVIATGVIQDGREVVSVMVGDSETEAFWTQFLCHLRERELTGVRLVISDSHSGLVKTIDKVMLGAAWQRCRVHFVRNVFAAIPKGSAKMVAATIGTVFVQPTANAVRSQLDTVANMLGRQFPKVREMQLKAKEDLTAFTDFPHQHWTKTQSTNPLEQRNQTPHRRRPGLPEPARRPSPGHRRPHRTLRQWIAFPRRYLSNEGMDALRTDDTIVLPTTSND